MRTPLTAGRVDVGTLARFGRAAIAGIVMLSALALAGMTCTREDEPPPATPTAPVVPVAAVGLDAMSGRAFTLEGTGSPDRERFIALSVGRFHNCALREDGRALCWGWDSDERLEVPGGERFVAVSAGDYHTCGLRADGAALCWGRWSHQGLAATSVLDEQFVAISSGAGHACGLREDGMAICWGQGPGSNVERWPIPSDTFIAIFSPESGPCGIKADGAAVCWSIRDDRYSQSFGWTKEKGLASLLPEFGLTEEQGLASLSRGGRCSLKISGEIICPEPDVAGADVLPGERLRYMGSSWNPGHRGFVCGIRPDGSAACWPVKPTSDHDWNIPKIPSTQKFLDIGAGHDHACGLLADGSIKCWGDNFEGEGTPPPTQPGPTPAPPSDVICNPGVVIAKGSGCKFPEFTKMQVRRFAVAADGLGIVYGEADEVYQTRYVSIDISFNGNADYVDDGWYRLTDFGEVRCEGAGSVEDTYRRSLFNAPPNSVVVIIPPPPDTKCTVLAARADENGDWIIDKAMVWERESRA